VKGDARERASKGKWGGGKRGNFLGETHGFSEKKGKKGQLSRRSSESAFELKTAGGHIYPDRPNGVDKERRRTGRTWILSEMCAKVRDNS